MGNRRKKRGVLTIFVSLLLTGVLGFVGTVTEAVRIMGARMQAQVASDCATDSLLSEYDALLLENYYLFFRNGLDGEEVFLQENMAEDMKSYMEKMLSPQSAHGLLSHSDFWKLQTGNCIVQEYTLATDHDCEEYRKQAADSVKTIIGEELLGKLKEWESNPVNVTWLEQSLEDREKKNKEQTAQVVEDSLNTSSEDQNQQEGNGEDGGQGEENLYQEQKAQKMQETVDSVENDTKVNERDNPIAIIKEIKEKGILQLVLPENLELSEKTISKDNLVSSRSLQKGNGSSQKSTAMDALEQKLLFHEYICRTFSCALEQKQRKLEKGSVLDYELEYMIVGKDSDVENLKAVVHDLLLMREAVNYGYLLTDQVKQLQAETLAVAITGSLGVVALTTVVKHGILLAWAYGESIMDVRQLLAGGSLTLVKTQDQWQLGLENFASVTRGEAEKKETENGLSYMDYLRLLLFATNEKTLTLRSLDMIEQTMGKQYPWVEYRMDGMVGSFVIRTTCQIAPLFYGLWPATVRKELGGWDAVPKGQYRKEFRE